ncbi:hypothetical protein BDR03DRAFT_983777 [Suillus americanus]|nr:hypothetical protein BDR03DRAFT_983777 [Suillus americanus]
MFSAFVAALIGAAISWVASATWHPLCKAYKANCSAPITTSGWIHQSTCSVLWVKVVLVTNYSFFVAISDTEFAAYIVPSPINLPTSVSTHWTTDMVGNSINPPTYNQSIYTSASAGVFQTHAHEVVTSSNRTMFLEVLPVRQGKRYITQGNLYPAQTPLMLSFAMGGVTNAGPVNQTALSLGGDSTDQSSFLFGKGQMDPLPLLGYYNEPFIVVNILPTDTLARASAGMLQSVSNHAWNYFHSGNRDALQRHEGAFTLVSVLSTFLGSNLCSRENRRLWYLTMTKELFFRRLSNSEEVAG